MSRSSRRRLRNQRYGRRAKLPGAESSRAPTEALQWGTELAWRHVPFLLLIPVIFISMLVLPGSIRPPIIEFACETTGCTSTGMTTATWILITLPLWYVVAGVLFRRLLTGWRQLLYGLGLVVCSTLALAFTPRKYTPLDDIVAGPGAVAMKTGIIWGWLSILLASATAVILSWLVGYKKRKLSLGRRVLVVVLISLVPLPVAVVRADPVHVEALQLFPDETLTINDDTLRRTSAADQRGCAGLLTDDRPLGDCVRTARLTFTTDDSDAVVHLAAVLYSSKEAVAAARDRIPEDAAQLGITGDTVTVRTVVGYWLVLCSVRHADGRPILAEERGYLLWPAKQVQYYLAGTSSGIFLAPTPDEDIGPRTP